MHTCLNGQMQGYILMYACLKQFHAYIYMYTKWIKHLNKHDTLKSRLTTTYF